MAEDDLGSRLVCMATGAVALAAGALLGAAAGPYKGPLRKAPKSLGSGLRGGLAGDVASRPVSGIAPADASAMNEKELSSRRSAALETRLQAMEALTSKGFDVLLDRLQQLEQHLEQSAVDQSQAPPLEALIAEAQAPFSSRVTAVEGRLEEHDTTVRQLLAGVTRLETQLQIVTETTERLAAQMSPAPVLPPLELTEKARPSRWKAFALAGAMAAVLLGGWSAFRLVDHRFLRLENRMEQVDSKLSGLGIVVAVLKTGSEEHDVTLRDLQARTSGLDASLKKATDSLQRLTNQVRQLLPPSP